MANEKIQTSNVKKGKIYKGIITEEVPRREKTLGKIENPLSELSLFPKNEDSNQKYGI